MQNDEIRTDESGSGNDAGVGTQVAGTAAEAVQEAEDQKVNKAKHRAKKVLSEKQKAVLEKNKLKKNDERTKKLGAMGGSAKGAAYELLRELVAEAKARNNVRKIFDDLDHGDFQNALARLSVLKQSGASFDQTDEGKTKNIDLNAKVDNKLELSISEA